MGAHPTPERRRKPEGVGLEAATGPARAPGPEVLLTASGGYSLDVTAEQTDVGRFEQAVDAARTAAGPHERWQHLDRAVRMWRGLPGPAPEYDADVATELSRLVELRDLALEDRADAALQLGRHRELVPELEALVAQAPLRERRTALLMLALSHSGRQADALAAFRRLRARLVDELGLEPSAELRAVEGAVLSQAGTTTTPPALMAASGPRPGSSRAWWVRRAGAVAVVGVVTAAVMAAVAWPADDRRLDPPIGVARLHPRPATSWESSSFSLALASGRASDRWCSTNGPCGCATTSTRPSRGWSSTAGSSPHGARGRQRRDLTIAGGDLWVANPGDNTVTRVDGQSGAVVATIPVGLAPQGITSADGDVWVAIHRGEPSGAVWRIDVDTNEVVAAPAGRAPRPRRRGGDCGGADDPRTGRDATARRRPAAALDTRQLALRACATA